MLGLGQLDGEWVDFGVLKAKLAEALDYALGELFRGKGEEALGVEGAGVDAGEPRRV